MYCCTGAKPVVSSYGPHFGEESPVVGTHGSGTIFFTNCNLKCIYCQNFDISQGGIGSETSPERLAEMMLDLRKRGCHNINLVSPSHVAAQFVESLLLAAEQGLSIPIVYNTGGYDSVETLRFLDGIVDIYMPDIKYSESSYGARYSGASNYFEIAREAVKEMHRQVGDLTLDDSGVAQRGLLVRHLVLPNDLAGTAEIVSFIAQEISKDTYLNIMDQYRPCHKASRFPELNRRITSTEYRAAVLAAKSAGLWRI